jgi:hypothetical protein
MSATTETATVTTPKATPAPSTARSNGYDICRPPEPREGESEHDALVRLQREMEDFRDCVNAELKVRSENSLLTLILLKVFLPFTAITAGLTAVYLWVLQYTDQYGRRAELVMALIYFGIVLLFLWIWLGFKNEQIASRRNLINRGVANALNLNVPPRKEKLTRNQMVNRWIFLWLTWGLLLLLPTIFLLFRVQLLHGVVMEEILENTGLCDDIAGDFDPYQGSESCANVDDNVEPPTTSGKESIGGANSAGDQIAQPVASDDEVNSAEVRLDVTTSLGSYFFILIAGIVVTMIRWWWIQRNVRGSSPPQAASSA